MLALMEKVLLLILDQHTAVRHALAVRLASASEIEIIGTGSTDPDANDPGLLQSADVALVGIMESSEFELGHIVNLVKQLTTSGTAVLALTSFIDDFTRELIMDAGASRYLLKNINTPQLIAEIHSVVAERAG